MTAAVAQLLLGAITIVLSLRLPLGTLRTPDTGFFPLLLGVALLGLSTAQAIRLLLARRPHAPAAAAPPAAPAAPAAGDGGTRRVVLFAAVIALATALLAPVGFVLASSLLMTGLLRVLGVGWRNALVIALGSAVASHFIFVRWLGIPMPAGPLGF
jgi:hypothetical protein